MFLDCVYALPKGSHAQVQQQGVRNSLRWSMVMDTCVGLHKTLVHDAEHHSYIAIACKFGCAHHFGSEGPELVFWASGVHQMRPWSELQHPSVT